MSYIENLITDYYLRVNRQRDDFSRDHESTLSRQAIMVALNEVANMSEIGKEFSKDHTTVLYAKRKHERNMRNLDYIELYETAKETINVVVGKIDTEIFSDKNKAREFIFALVRENNYLRSELSN
tara:strand:+ start:151 stop:525 length:375 start_codon:yes stop_codon:yes gene_type:complete